MPSSGPLLCVAIVVVLSMPARAQYVFDIWRTEDGLPQNSVYAIRQTRDGYLWATTYDGLVGGYPPFADGCRAPRRSPCSLRFNDGAVSRNIGVGSSVFLDRYAA